MIRDALAPHKDGLLDKLWAVVEKPEKGKESQRLRAAAALAKYDPDSKRWASTLQTEDVVFLATLQEKNVRVLDKFFRKDGFVNCSGLFPIVVGGVRCPNSLFTHPAAHTFASVSYDLDRPYKQFLARVGIPALAPNQKDPTAPLTFEVIGNGKSIWKSTPLAKQGAIQDCAVNMLGVKQLALRVDNPGLSTWAHPVWLEPRLIADQTDQVTVAVVNDLVAVPAADVSAWKAALRPVRRQLLAPLSVVYRSLNRSEEERSRALDFLADYADDQPQVLAELLMGADEKQFAQLLPNLQARGEQGLPALLGEINRTLPPDATEEAKEQLVKRQVNAAVALLRLNRPEKVWPLLKAGPDPRTRSYLIHRLSPLGVDAQAIVQQLDKESAPTIRAGAASEPRRIWRQGHARGTPNASAEVAGVIPDGGRSGDSCSRGMAAAAVEGGNLDQGNQPNLGRRHAAAGEETPDHRTGVDERDGQGRNAAGTSMGRDRRWWSFPVPWSSGWVLRRTRQAATKAPRGQRSHLPERISTCLGCSEPME